jgi:hypothetical protein
MSRRCGRCRDLHRRAQKAESLVCRVLRQARHVVRGRAREERAWKRSALGWYARAAWAERVANEAMRAGLARCLALESGAEAAWDAVERGQQERDAALERVRALRGLLDELASWHRDCECHGCRAAAAALANGGERG